MSGSGTDGFFAQDDSLSPSEAHNTLKKRNKLYEGLQDHELVQKYDDVRGMVKNLFFVTHNHKENGGTDDTTSKYNVYEVRITVCIERRREVTHRAELKVEMIRDLVLYLLR